MKEIYKSEVVHTMKVFREKLEDDLNGIGLDKVEVNCALFLNDLSDAFSLTPLEKREVLGRRLFAYVTVMIDGEVIDGWVLETSLPELQTPAVAQ